MDFCRHFGGQGAPGGVQYLRFGVKNQENWCQNAIPKTMRDILSMLISIYGTREIFVDEYRQMLADK